MRVDESTEASSQAKYARINVEIDLSKPLIAKFRMRRRIWKMEYEGLHLVCFGCGTYGHRRDHCPLESPVVVEPGNCKDQPIEPVVVPPPIACPPTRPEIVENYGAWMLVQRTKRGRPRTSAPRGNSKARGGPVNDGRETFISSTGIDGTTLPPSSARKEGEQEPPISSSRGAQIGPPANPTRPRPYVTPNRQIVNSTMSMSTLPCMQPMQLAVPQPHSTSLSQLSDACPPGPGCEPVLQSYPPEPPDLTVAAARISHGSHCGDEMESCTVPETPLGPEIATLEAGMAGQMTNHPLSGGHGSANVPSLADYR
ncbi:hypothetical protein K2173_007845 [Erythroxylum novogranatense]|uniref:CCHC-type domain-containing protein n=1 Tax=Erythroxylum novogranatense TaxID=1862640 RepID=A0AAV8S722_9ROSI|nr:hypothetical protein K2173_007845 [Erythroxylum novogranatense]